MTPILKRSTILKLHETAVSLGLARKDLLSGLPAGFVAGLEETSSKAGQILMDLSRFNTIVELKDGVSPLLVWLENAIGLSKDFKEEGQVFLNALKEASGALRERAMNEIRKIAIAHEAQQPPPPLPPPPAKAKILFLSANPAGRDRLAIGREFNAVESELLKAPDGRQLSLIPAFDTGAGELSRVLLEHEPTVLHFSGHGDSTGKLVITSRLGGGDKIEADALAGLLESFKTHLRCVVLNACFSKIVGDALREHIDVVIGMSRAISDDAAIQFSTGFYRAIAFHKDVNTAFKLALSQIDLSHLPDADKPQLLCKVGTDSNTVVLFPKSS